MSNLAKPYDCVVTEMLWITPTVMRIRFEPNAKFSFLAGQFVSIVVPPRQQGQQPVKRCYSLASGPEQSRIDGYELCVKYVAGGRGSEFLATLTVGDHFQAFASYGHFVYEPKEEERSVVFVATGTGIAPFKSMAESNVFQDHKPRQTTMLLGVRHEEDIVYKGVFEALGIHEVHAVSQPKGEFSGFEGRVTDFLRLATTQFSWQSTDFYLCGNAEMIHETREVLMSQHGVPPTSIKQESFTGIVKSTQKPFKPVLLPKAA